MSGYCSGCGQLFTEAGGHAQCLRRQRATDPPRYCTTCGRKLAVQVLPTGWRARCVRCGEISPSSAWQISRAPASQ